MLKNIFIYLLPLLSCSLLAQNTIQSQLGATINYVVAKDGSGQYSTIQAAVNAVPSNSATSKIIFIKKGTYTEKVEIPSNKTNLVFIGEDVENTLLVYNDFSGSGKVYNGIISSANGLAIGTSTSHTLYVAANDFTMMNMTIKNSAGDVGQAVAFNSNGDRHFLFHCKLIGYQDTYYTWKDGRFFIKDTYIEGAIDYIFGRGIALFDSCQIHSVRSGSYITAAATDQNFKYGYVFNNCKLTAATGTSSIYLGRPWKPYGQTVFLRSEISSFVNSAGWSIWNGNENHLSCYYAEYNNCGTGSSVTKRVSWSHQLSATEAAAYTKEKMFDKNASPIPYASSWIPLQESNAPYSIVKKNTSRFISNACFQTVTSTTEEKEAIKEETCFPNPFHHEFVIQLPGHFDYTLFDLNGNMLLKGNGVNRLIIAQTLPPGMYFLQINNKYGTKHIKLVKTNQP